MKLPTLEIWFTRNEDRLEALLESTSMTSYMQKHLDAEDFPATEMSELHTTLKRAEELLLDLKQSVLTKARGE